jgi:hypothetical protein
MKISAWHKDRGDSVEWWNGLIYYDRVYKAKVFDFTEDIASVIQADEVLQGGTGYDLQNRLSDEIESCCPDYELYRGFDDTAYGFLTRGCPRSCGFCIVSEKEGRRSRKVADLNQFHRGQKNIKLLDPNLLSCVDHMPLLYQLRNSGATVDFTQGLDARLLTDENIRLITEIKTSMIHFAWDSDKQSDLILDRLRAFRKVSKDDMRKLSVYVLTNFDTGFEFDLERIYRLREMGYTPYVMVYDKANAPSRIRYLQRWCNNKVIFRTCERFEDYDRKLG